MIDVDALRGAIAKKRHSQASMARILGITPKTFYDKMKKGVFDSDEMEIMIIELDIENPADIFFINAVTHYATNEVKK